MYDCQHLAHPFLHDPGVSQTDRALKALLPENIRIDGRKTADLLNYFSELSRQINYYNPDLSISDWVPFFDDNLAFLLSQVAAYPLQVQQEKLSSYIGMLERNATASGLQLLLFYSYYTTILPLQRWAVRLEGTGVDLETSLNKQIKENLQQPLLSFISLANTASHCYGVRKIDFTDFLAIPAWGLEQADLYAYQGGFVCSAGGTRGPILSLWESVSAALPFFTGVIGQVSDGAANDVNNNLQALLTLDGKQDLPPHLALLFSFITIFSQLQSDLNVYAKKHLHFFYTRVLRLKPAPAVPDKAHLVFSIQQQFAQYALDQGLLVKDGKDNNKADILFGLDETLVVNQAKITDTRTLFLNNLNHYDQVYTEGVYMAPNSLMADGLTKPFADPTTASWPTLGSRLSKYTPTGDADPIPYPAARMGFILHSPVLLLNEGLRTITIKLACTYDAGICTDALPGELGMADLLPGLQTLFNTPANPHTYFNFTQDSLAAALGQGLDPALGQTIAGLLTKKVTDCYTTSMVPVYDVSVSSTVLGSDADAVAVFFPRRSVFQLQFSGAKGWVAPTAAPLVALTVTGVNEFSLVFTVTLDPTLPAVTFFDKKVFGVDYKTTDPLVMVLLDDTIKIPYTSLEPNPGCCLEPKASTDDLLVSTYHFFKHVQIIDSTGGVDTSIVTDVCGLKNFIVQNDQSVMDVNSPVYPFGTRPTIIDFDVVINNDPFKPGTPNLRGPNFYIGSAEIFCKAWTAVWIGINWKDKPSSFNEYYAGYVKTGSGNMVTDYGLDQNCFEVNVSALSSGGWTKERSDGVANSGFLTSLGPLPGLDFNRKLFDSEPDGMTLACAGVGTYDYSFYIRPTDFPITPGFSGFPVMTKYNADTRQGFIRFTLEKQDFLHKDYSYVLARQMIAFGKLPQNLVSGAVYYSDLFGYYVVDTTALFTSYTQLATVAADIDTRVGIIESEALSATGGTPINAGPADNIRIALGDSSILNPPPFPTTGLIPDADKLDATVTTGIATLTNPSNPLANPSAVIPKEPWTPIIQNMVIHYSATATVKDMGLIHLYPYDGTYEIMDIESTPNLLPLFCAEGLLFLGVQNLMPGENLNILFQLAEATADSEDAPDLVNWEYLTNNQWMPLAPDFQVIEDATQNLTSSGIIELSIPKDISSTNTVMPAGLCWLRASVPSHTPGVCETLALFTQAVQASFIPNSGDPTTATAANDLTRLSAPLAAGSLAKLNTANAVVTGVQQPYPSFGGQAPESAGTPLFVRLSELLRHKGRGIQKWDYERLVLQNYPQVLRAKCINHSYFLNAHQYRYDFPMAPGNVMVAVIPDVSQLASADSLQPRVPVAILEEIRTWLLGIISPFIQLFVANPRYEPIDFCLKLVLVKGADEDFYQQQVKKDLTTYLAPWLTDEMDRFAFGLPLYRSDVIRFLESLDYIDYILDLEMKHQGDNNPDPNNPAEGLEPLTPRSILIAGDIAAYIIDPVPDPGKPPIPDCANKPIPVSDHCSQPSKKAMSVK